MGEPERLPVPAEAAGERLDRFLASRVPGLSRALAQKLILCGAATLDGRQVPKDERVREGQVVTLRLPAPEPTDLVPEPIPLDVVYEDPDLLVVNKPRGLVVHPGAGRRRGTLVNALLARVQDLSGVGGRLRPGIVHRLDKDTSGLLWWRRTTWPTSRWRRRSSTGRWSGATWRWCGGRRGRATSPSAPPSAATLPRAPGWRCLRARGAGGAGRR